MYILTNKALAKREHKAWSRGNADATKAWQCEFEQQTKEYKAKLNKLEKIVTKYVTSTNEKMKKADIYNNFILLSGDLLNEIEKLK